MIYLLVTVSYLAASSLLFHIHPSYGALINGGDGSAVSWTKNHVFIAAVREKKDIFKS